MSAAIAWFGGSMVAAALLMLLVLAMRGPAARLFGAKVAYALWLLPVLRMVLPPLPAQWVPTASGMIFTPHMVGWAPEPPSPADVFTPLPLGAAAGPDWLTIVAFVWFAGALGHFLWHMVAYRLFLRRSLRGAVELTHAAGIRVLACPAIAGPMAAGILNRRILLPSDFTLRFDPDERRLVLAHETAHHVRGDLVANLVALILLSLHWFNPLAYRAYHAFRDDQEAACDATVLDAEPTDRRHAYGTAILKSAQCRVPGAACALNHAGALKRRLRIMIDGRKNPALRLGGIALALALVAGGLVATASTPAAAGESSPMIRIDDSAGHTTVIDDGHVRPATPAERRQADRAVERASRAAEHAGRVADAAMREAQRALADIPPPPPAMLPPLAPLPPGAPDAAQVPPIDHAAIAAEVRAAMQDAHRSIEAARADVARVRIAWPRDHQDAVREAAAIRVEALTAAAETRRAAEAARASLR